MIRVFYTDGTHADLPDETLAFPFAPPDEDEIPATLEEERRDHKATFVKVGEVWRHARIETREAEARRLRSELEAAEKRLADLRAWAEGKARGAEGAFQEVVGRIDGKESA